jgi:hypothetical protein
LGEEEERRRAAAFLQNLRVTIRNANEREGGKKSQSSFINICWFGTIIALSELTAGNIDSNALNDDKYFPVELSPSLSLSLSLFPSLFFALLLN